MLISTISETARAKKALFSLYSAPLLLRQVLVIFAPKSYTVSISIVLRFNFPVFDAVPATADGGLSCSRLTHQEDSWSHNDQD